MKIYPPINSAGICKLLTRIAIGALIIQMTACATPFQVIEQSPELHDEGTLLLGEVIRPLSLAEVTARYKKSDLEMAGWSKTDIKTGNAVIISNFKQRQGWFDSAHVYYALVKKNSAIALEYNKACLQPGRLLGCVYGGDAVSFRIVRKPIELTHPSGLNVVEEVIEPRGQEGDCAYLDRGWSKRKNYRFALFCESLYAKGWGWHGDEFIKRP